MRKEGEEAAGYDAVRLDSGATINQGTLTLADDLTGDVTWKDKAGESRSEKYQAHAIAIVARSRYSRS